jgi:hypothetical protein
MNRRRWREDRGTPVVEEEEDMGELFLKCGDEYNVFLYFREMDHVPLDDQ